MHNTNLPKFVIRVKFGIVEESLNAVAWLIGSHDGVGVAGHIEAEVEAVGLFPGCLAEGRLGAFLLQVF